VIPIGEYGSEGEGREQDHWSVPSTNSKKCHKSLRSNGAAESLAYHSSTNGLIKFAKGNSSIGFGWMGIIRIFHTTPESRTLDNGNGI
jgi:hypothetical protein